MHFSELMNFAIDFDQLFVRIFENFWQQSIRRPQENVFLLGAKFKINFETILHDLLRDKPKSCQPFVGLTVETCKIMVYCIPKNGQPFAHEFPILTLKSLKNIFPRWE